MRGLNARRGYFPLQTIPSSESQRDAPQSFVSRARLRVLSGFRTSLHHFKRHVGVGIICSVAYFDPGNWSVDLQAGSSFGYRPMLFVILLTGVGAILFQALACKLGCVTGLDLASHCRLLLHDHPRHPRLVRRLVLYPLYVSAEVAIVATDLAELLGSAIGLCLLFPGLPLWAGVVLTAVDVLVFLSISNPSDSEGRPVKVFEYTIMALVFAVFSCFIALLVKADPDWSQVFLGYIPDSALFRMNPDAIYIAVGILGATVMPHALFLGSMMATQDRVSEAPSEALTPPSPSKATIKSRIRRTISKLFRIDRADRETSTKDYRSKYGERENNSLAFIHQHLFHGVVDIVSSLVAIAVPINSAILILAAAVFYKGPNEHNDVPAGLFDAHDLIKSRIGSAAAFIFALALVCAGQMSSITVTLAGQSVSEGFIEWKISPFFRRLITRCISLVPSVVVAIAVGRDGINALLVASQVVLSVVLPFVAFPLIYLTSSEVVMRVRVTPPDVIQLETPQLRQSATSLDYPEGNESTDTIPLEVCDGMPEVIDYSNGFLLTILSYVIWGVIFIANAYAIVMLMVHN